MGTLLLKGIQTLVTCGDGDAVLRDVDILCEDGIIRRIGPELGCQAEEVLDCRHLLCYPGLVNTHHHLYQCFSRNLPQVQNLELFDWLKALYEIWKNLDEKAVRLSSLTAMGEMMKHGCTTCFDHHYVFPRDAGDLIGVQLAASEELGMRMVSSRGSMDLSVKDGGLPPDSVVQPVDAILADSVRLIETYHDPSYGSMRQIVLAPCSPFSVSGELLRQSALLARQYKVRLHTHLCETKDEERYTLERFGLRPLAYMERLGWLGDAQVFVRTAAINFRVDAFFRKWLNDLMLEQREDGALFGVVPKVPGRGTRISSPGRLIRSSGYSSSYRLPSISMTAVFPLPLKRRQNCTQVESN